MRRFCKRFVVNLPPDPVSGRDSLTLEDLGPRDTVLSPY